MLVSTSVTLKNATLQQFIWAWLWVHKIGINAVLPNPTIPFRGRIMSKVARTHVDSCTDFQQESVDSPPFNELISKEILRGNLLWQPSWHHVWRRVTVPLDFLKLSLPSNFVKREMPFPCGLNPRTHICYRAVNRAESERTITHLHMWRSIWFSVNTGVRKRPDSPF